MTSAAWVAIVALVILPALYLHDAAREQRQRDTFFAASTSLFQTYHVVRDGKYPVLEGRYRGERVRLEPVLDAMAARKVPSLWLKVTVLRPNPGRPTFSFLMRPDGNEFYSPSVAMAHRQAIPADWPQNAVLCTDNMDLDPHEYDDLDASMAAFTDPRAKELVASPKGVRFVYQAAQGERAHYLVLRQARFDIRQANPGLVASLIDRAITFADALDDGACAGTAFRTVGA